MRKTDNESIVIFLILYVAVHAPTGFRHHSFHGINNKFNKFALQCVNRTNRAMNCWIKVRYFSRFAPFFFFFFAIFGLFFLALVRFLPFCLNKARRYQFVFSYRMQFIHLPVSFCFCRGIRGCCAFLLIVRLFVIVVVDDAVCYNNWFTTLHSARTIYKSFCKPKVILWVFSHFL